MSEDEGSCVDPYNNNYDSNNNHQHGYDSTNDSWNEHNVDKSEDDNDCDLNDICQDKEAATISRRSHSKRT